MLQKNILLPTELKIVSEGNYKGEYQIDKLYPGYGHTLGNSLRRVILSSLPGIAITRFFIEGVSHEFSVIEGVKEDVINIILNLKKVVFKMDTTEKILRISLKIKKNGIVTAKDLNTPSQVEIINPDQYLFTMNDKKELNIEMEIQEGLGFVLREEIQKKKKLNPGEIVMDTSFTPIRKVSYEVSSTRVGDRTDFNKITFFIETDGSIKPTDAIKKSVNIMIEQFSAIINKDILKNNIIESEITKSIANSIAQLDLDENTLEKIAKEGVLKISELSIKTDEEILNFKGIVKKDLINIKKALIENINN
ncbi:MAG: DNA-directed RNA polymerase subunit alpha [Candidatus Pacebacteria bacterium]|nr:DNA-directed RNA polymerase subunit alpha [Candidatus Paceibacterota bacterium]